MATYTQHYEAYHGDEPHADVLARMSTPERIAWHFIADISDRRGLGQEWDQIDEEVQDEIFAELVGIAQSELDAPPIAK